MGVIAAGCLQGVKVVDLTMWVSGPLAAQILGDHGAEVLKVEPPEGDAVRQMGTAFNEYGFAASYFSLNRNKKSIALDLRTHEGREVLFRLLEEADILLSNRRPGVLEKLGLGYEDVLRKRFPRLILGVVSGFGVDGPLGGLPGMDPVGQAMSGIMSRQGTPDGPPERINFSVADHTSGLYLAIGVLAALIERNRSGKGQALEITLLEATLSLNHPFAADWFMTGIEPPRLGNGHVTVAPVEVYPCRNGHVLIGCADDKQFRALCRVLGQPEMAHDPRFSTNLARVEHRREVDDFVTSVCTDWDKNELTVQLLQNGVPGAAVLSMGEALNHPQVLARNNIIKDETVGFRALGTPIKCSRTPGGLFQRPARLGEHSRELMRKFGFTEDAIEDLIKKTIVVESPPVINSVRSEPLL
jgi:crotonobetainyl-CoA:carnitine CoA-transferase CaiB-like acyl-CoA transferase